MNRILIVGNGFDLAHGVKTSYKDFIEWYFGKAIESLKQGKCITEMVDGILNIFVLKMVIPNPYLCVSILSIQILI